MKAPEIQHYNWDQVFVAARSGNESALGLLLIVLERYLRAIAQQELPTRLQAKADSSDFVQQTLLDVTKNFARFQGHGLPEWRAWARATLLNNIARFRRDFRRQCRNAKREVPLADSDRALVVSTTFISRDLSPDRRAMESEQLQSLHAALGRLPLRYEEIIRLRTDEKRPYDEIGVRLGISADAAQKLWGRAIRRLADELKYHSQKPVQPLTPGHGENSERS